MKSSLFVAFMIKYRQDFTEYKSSEKANENVTFFSVGAVLASL
jgi:hypothetical protein